jgi:acetate---CoA ligase (ADP-forming)
MDDRETILARFAPLFLPQSVAVVGASAEGKGPGNNFLRHLRAFGFAGAIYPIHPTASEIEGLPAYRSLGETPTTIDYAYIAVAASRVRDAIAAANGRVRFAQVMSSGFAERADGRQRQDDLLTAARTAGVRLLGPNCMGTHSPRGRLTFVDAGEATPGGIGVLSQSGGLSIDILRRGQVRGLSFSALVTLGNSADVDVCDLLEYMLADSETRVIGIYLEDVGNGRRFFTLLRDAHGAKPVVLLKGGRTQQGQRATASHTGALAGDDRIWSGLARQTGLAMVDTLDEMLDALIAFQALACRTNRPTERMVLFGNGGGTSVLAADCFGRLGFRVDPLDARALAALEHLRLPAGSSIINPIDIPANALRADGSGVVTAILDAVMAHDPPEAIVIHVNIPVVLDYKDSDILENIIRAALQLHSSYAPDVHVLLVLRSDGDPECELRKQRHGLRATQAGIPVFGELIDAAKALAAVRDCEGFRQRLTSSYALSPTGDLA